MSKIKKWEPDDFELEMTTHWSFPKRGDWATHDAKWRGNWSPYIPRNIILRYSQEGDLVLDQFAGGGTTLVEAKLLNRDIIGVDCNDEDLNRCKEKNVILSDKLCRLTVLTIRLWMYFRTDECIKNWLKIKYELVVSHFWSTAKIEMAVPWLVQPFLSNLGALVCVAIWVNYSTNGKYVPINIYKVENNEFIPIDLAYGIYTKNSLIKNFYNISQTGEYIIVVSRDAYIYDVTISELNDDPS